MNINGQELHKQSLLLENYISTESILSQKINGQENIEILKDKKINLENISLKLYEI